MSYATKAGAGLISAQLMAFGAWMSCRRTPVTPADVVERFGVGRSTAYRWLALWREVMP